MENYFDGINKSSNILINDTINTTNSIISSFPESSEWQMGIFAIIGASMTFLGIILTLRFLSIDKTLKDRISKLRDTRTEIIDISEENYNKTEKINIREIIDNVSVFSELINENQSYRANNKKVGVFTDLFGMIFLVILGLLAAMGVFSESYIVLSILVFLCIFIPIIHFIHKMSQLSQFSKLDNISTLSKFSRLFDL